MIPPLYLSYARMKRDAPVKALLPLLLGGGDPSPQPGHRLVWSLFAEESGTRRDFLWREMETRGAFLILSARPPSNPFNLFDLAEPKPFSPMFTPGQRLRFSLRANPVIRRRRAGPTGRRSSSKHDVVMDRLHRQAAGMRAENRFDTMNEQGFTWLERQGAGSGFTIQQDGIGIDGYRQHRIPRKGSRVMRFSTLDFDGVLEVRDPIAFLAGISRGFGAAKAYGCGLMLVRRA